MLADRFSKGRAKRMWGIGRAMALISAALGASAAGAQAWGSGWVVFLSVLVVPASLAAVVALCNARGEFAGIYAGAPRSWCWAAWPRVSSSSTK